MKSSINTGRSSTSSDPREHSGIDVSSSPFETASVRTKAVVLSVSFRSDEVSTLTP